MAPSTPDEAMKSMTTPTKQSTDKLSNWELYLNNVGTWLNPNKDKREDKTFLTGSNASTYLDQNQNLTKEQKDTIKDTINADNQTIYHITIGEIKANNFDEIMKSLKSIQSNQK